MPTKLPNIRIREKRGRIVLDYYFAGRRYQEWIGASSPETMRVAERRRTAIESEIERGTHADRKEDAKREQTEGRWLRLSLAEFVTGEYLERVRTREGDRLQPESERRARNAAAHFAEFFGERPIVEIRRVHVQAYLTKRRDAGASKGTVRREKAMLQAAFNRFLDWSELAIANPCRGLKLGKPARRNQRFESEAEAEAVISKCPRWLQWIVRFDRATGLRESELLAVTREQVKPQWHMLKIGAGQTTTGRTKSRNSERDVPLNAAALAVLREIPVKDGPVFVGARGKAISGKYMNRRFQKALVAAGVRSVTTFHGLRHDFSSRLSDHGVSNDDRARILGHSIPGVTEGYTHVRFSHLLDVVRLLDRKPKSRRKVETQVETSSKVAC